MGWGDCGKDSKGRPIGYVFEATCDHSGCNEKIDCGLAYACGGMHGQNEDDCEGYFCGKHLVYTDSPLNEWSAFRCVACAKLIEEQE